MKFLRQKKLIAGLAALAVLAFAAVGGYAYWTSTNGTGVGTAATGTITTGLHVTQAPAPGPPFTPGGIGQVLNGTVESTIALGGATVYVNTVTATLDDPSGAGPSCDTSDYEFVGGSGWTVTSGSSLNDTATHTPMNTNLVPLATTPWAGLHVDMVNKTSVNQDDCKNATLHINYVASAS